MARSFACMLAGHALCLAASAQAQTICISDRHQGLDQASQTFDRAGDANADREATRAFVAQCTDVIPFKG